MIRCALGLRCTSVQRASGDSFASILVNTPRISSRGREVTALRAARRSTRDEADRQCGERNEIAMESAAEQIAEHER